MIDWLVSFIIHARRLQRQYNFAPHKIVAIDETAVWNDMISETTVEASELFLPSWKREIFSSLEPSTANPRAHDFMELIIISFDKFSHTCKTHSLIFRRGFILPAAVYS